MNWKSLMLSAGVLMAGSTAATGAPISDCSIAAHSMSLGSRKTAAGAGCRSPSRRSLPLLLPRTIRSHSKISETC